MFQQRQFQEVSTMTEISISAALSPGAVTAGTSVGVSAACTLAGTTVPATFSLGDTLVVYGTAAAALNGINVTAAPGPTAGTCIVTFQNGTGGSITPTAASIYRIVATRLIPGAIS